MKTTANRREALAMRVTRIPRATSDMLLASAGTPSVTPQESTHMAIRIRQTTAMAAGLTILVPGTMVPITITSVTNITMATIVVLPTMHLILLMLRESDALVKATLILRSLKTLIAVTRATSTPGTAFLPSRTSIRVLAIDSASIRNMIMAMFLVDME